MIKVEWFRFSAKAARWKEEVALLEEEIRRTQQFFLHNSNLWSERSRAAMETGSNQGKAAYCAWYVRTKLSRSWSNL